MTNKCMILTAFIIIIIIINNRPIYWIRQDIDVEVLSFIFSTVTKITDVLYHLGAVILIITVIYAVFKIGSGGYITSYRTAIVFILLFLSAIVYYANIELNEFDEEQRQRTVSAVESAMLGVRYFAKNEMDMALLLR